MSDLSWQQCWNRFNTMLADECADDVISEEDMENLLDHGQLTSSAEELRYFAARNGYPLVNGDKDGFI